MVCVSVCRVHNWSQTRTRFQNLRISPQISRFQVGFQFRFRFHGISGFQEGFQDLKSQDFTPDFAFQQISRYLLHLYNISATVAHNYVHGRRARLRMSTRKGAVTSNQKYRACAQLNYITKPGYPGRPVLAPPKRTLLKIFWEPGLAVHT